MPRVILLLAVAGTLATSCSTVDLPGRASAKAISHASPQVAVPFSATTGYAFSTLSYGPDKTHLADLFMPGGSDRVFGDKTPLVIYVHGGAWLYGSRQFSIPGPIIALTKRGWAVASIDYRPAVPSSPAPAQEQDVARAIVWFKANAPRLGIDADTVVLSGHSAGGHLAVLVGTACRRESGSVECPPEIDAVAPVDGSKSPRPDVRAIITLSGIYDVIGWSTTSEAASRGVAGLLGCPTPSACPPATVKSQDPLARLDPTDPPTYLYHSTDDDIVPYSTQALVAIRGLEDNFGDRAPRMVWFETGESGGHWPDYSSSKGIADFVEAVRSGSL